MSLQLARPAMFAPTIRPVVAVGKGCGFHRHALRDPRSAAVVSTHGGCHSGLIDGPTLRQLRRLPLGREPVLVAWGGGRDSTAMIIEMIARGEPIAAALPETHALYRRMVALEIRSTFGFQGTRWLGDVAPELLSASMREGLQIAQQKAAARIELEKTLPREVLYSKPWPARLLTDEEAQALAYVRREVGALLEIECSYLDVQSIHRRYTQLIQQRNMKAAA
jgi:hypothetical protein